MESETLNKMEEESSDSENEDITRKVAEHSLPLVRLSAKRYAFQTKKLVAEVYNLQEEHDGDVWRQIEWNGDGINKKSNTFLSFHTLTQLRNCLAKGALILDLELEEQTFSAVFNVIAEEMAKKFKDKEHKLLTILAALCKSQQYLTEIHGPKLVLQSWIGNVTGKIEENSQQNNIEIAQIFASALPELEKARFAMVRLRDTLANVGHDDNPVRFIFVVLGPPQPQMPYKAMGCAIATLMSNPSFQTLSYKAADRQDLLSGLDKFLNEGVFIPFSSQLDEQMTISDIQNALNQKKNIAAPTVIAQITDDRLHHYLEPQRDPLSRTGRLFGGVVEDLRERMPKYLSDFTDAATFKTITSILFIFFACFAPAITFGGLLGNYTDGSMGIIEALMAQSLCGVIWALFSTQPLLLLTATGPVLIFEKAFYEICQSMELDFLTLRVWVAWWMLILTFVAVMLECSSLLRLVTRFTEEIFATLISAIFIMESMKFIYKTLHANPIRDLLSYWYSMELCTNVTNATHFDAHLWDYMRLWRHARADITHFAYLTPDEKYCFTHDQPDTALLTIILLFATFVVAYVLKVLRHSRFLTRMAREFIADFGLLIAIALVAVTKYFVVGDVYIKLLQIPMSFGFTSSEMRHGQLFISWLLPPDQWWGYLLAFVPAFLVFILLFAETEITELLLIKKELGLTKGSGLHWDMLLLSCLTVLCSLLGLPWMCAAASQSLAHASSLSVMKPVDVGQKPAIDHVVEQRVTAVVVSLLLGGCAFAGRALRFLPLAILFGVFFYLGVMGLQNMQFINRLVLFLVPPKRFPDVIYCQKVKPWRIHAFTIIQLLCVLIVYLVKSYQTALIFPIVLLLTCLLRHKALPLFYNNEELAALDGEGDEDEESDQVDMFSALRF